MAPLNGQDDALADLMAAKQWKQAFNLCEKKMKKAKGSDLHRVRMIIVLLSWPDPARQAQGAKHLDLLLDRKLALTDLDALLELDAALKDKEDYGRKTQQIWQKAAASRPTDELLHKLWYRSKFDAGDFRAAQQATIAWKKNSPKQRAPYFVYVLVTHLISEAPNDAMEKKISEGLVFKNLQAAVDALLDNETAKSAKAISTMQDLLFLLRIYRAQGKYEEAAKIIQTFRKFDFEPLQNEWEVPRQMIELFELSQNWAELYRFCRIILEDARAAILEPSTYVGPWGTLADDWKVWDGFVKASGKLEDPAYSSTTQELIASFKDKKINSRNAHLASMKIYHSEPAARPRNSDALAKAVWDYFTPYSIKVSVFQDIRPYLHHLTEDHQLEFIEGARTVSRTYWADGDKSDVHKIAWITIEINAVKLDYHLVVSNMDHPLWQPSLLPRFISNCLRLYSFALTFRNGPSPFDSRPGDDAALMAAMGLIRLHNMNEEKRDPGDGSCWHRHLFRSIAVLEYVLSTSPNNIDVLLTLTRLYMFLGAGSLAMERYSRLSIKNLQHTYMSWVLFSHISTIHPYPVQIASVDGRTQTTFDPLEEVTQTLHWFQTAEAKVKKNTLLMQENGQWEMSMDALATGDKLARNFARHQLFAECKRINRLTSSSHDVSNHPAVKIPMRTMDTNERVQFPSFEAHSQPHFEAILPIAGPRNPNDTWLEQQLSVARFWDVLHSNGQSPINESQLKAMKLGYASSQLEKTLTDPEMEAGNIVYTLERLHSFYYLKSSNHSVEHVGNCVRQLLAFLEDRVTAAYNNLASFVAEPPNLQLVHTLTWFFLHRQYTCLEICQYTVPVLNYIVAENVKPGYVDNKWLKDTVQRIKDQCKNIVVDVHRAAEHLKAKFVRPSAVQECEDLTLARTDAQEPGDEIGYNIREEFGDRINMTKVLKDLHASWIDGLDGVLRTKGAY